MNAPAFPAEVAGKVQQAIRENAIADRIKDALTDWQRENLDLSMRYRKADEFNRLSAEYRIGKLLGQLFQTDAPDFAENAAHELRVYHGHDPDDAWKDMVPETGALHPCQAVSLMPGVS